MWTDVRLANAQAQSLEECAVVEVLRGAEIVATTCVGAGESRLDGRPFRLCVVDEATQARQSTP